MDLDGRKQHGPPLGRPARSVRHVGNACCRKRPRRPQWRCELDRQQRQSLAFGGHRLRCQRQFWRSQRPVEIPASCNRSGADGYYDDAYARSRAESLHLWRAGDIIRAGLFHRWHTAQWGECYVPKRHNIYGNGAGEQRRGQVDHEGDADGHGLHHGGLRRRRELYRQHLDGGQPGGE